MCDEDYCDCLDDFIAVCPECGFVFEAWQLMQEDISPCCPNCLSNREFTLGNREYLNFEEEFEECDEGET